MTLDLAHLMLRNEATGIAESPGFVWLLLLEIKKSDRFYVLGFQVKLPGPSADKPNVYEFGTTYEEIYNDLAKKDKTLYTQNGILHMLDRNRRIKKRPQRLQLADKTYDVIFTAEERVYDQTLEHFQNEGSVSNQPVHIINIDIQVRVPEQLQLSLSPSRTLALIIAHW